MVVKSGMFNSVRDAAGNGDRKYEASFFASYFSSFIGNGVFPNPSSGMQVLQSTNLRTKVSAGKGWINGYYIINDGDFTIQHDVADGVLNRIDRIVMRLSFINRSIEIALLKGSFSSTPIAPALTRNENIHELALADVYIGRGVTQLLQSNITDTRQNRSLCGIVSGVVTQVDTTTLYNQYETFWNNYRNQKVQEFENLLSDSGNLLNAQLSNSRDVLEGQIQSNQQTFDDFLRELQDVLDGNVAANLLNMINANEQRAQQHYNDDIIHGKFSINGVKYQGQWLPVSDLKGLKFVYNEVSE